MVKMTISISENLQLFVNNSIAGEIEVPIKDVELINKRSIDRGVVITFNKKSGHRTEEVRLDLSIPLYYAQKHMDEQNARAEQMSIEAGYERLDRYEIKSMELKKVFLQENTVQLYFEWIDYVATSRIYYGEVCEIKQGANDLYATHKQPTFYF